MKNVMIEFSQAELDEILEYMDKFKIFETIQEAILNAVRSANKSKK